MDIVNVLNTPPYSLPKNEKEKILNSILNQLSRHHYNCSEPFKRMMNAIGYNFEKEYKY